VDKKGAAKLINVKEDMLKPFDVYDSFNDNNRLQGYICRQSDYRYGCLIIHSVKNKKIKKPQIVWATPKQHYPFDKTGNFTFPPITKLRAYEKIDGTNILAYRYQDVDGNEYITYKTRLTPVVRASVFGDFKSMLSELIESEWWIDEVINTNPEYNISFELYGSRNPITIDYNIPLALTVLFGVHIHDHSIIIPDVLVKTAGLHLYKYTPDAWDIREDEITSPEKCYQRLKEQMTLNNNNYDKLVHEGIVLYAFTDIDVRKAFNDNRWTQFKVKPDEILKIHWASYAISPNALWTTAINTFENKDEPSIDDFKELLQEEFSESQINKSEHRIKKIWDKAYKHVIITAKANEAWKAAQEEGLDITANKDDTMRFISKYFDKKEMRKVGAIILKQAGLI